MKALTFGRSVGNISCPNYTMYKQNRAEYVAQVFEEWLSDGR